MDARYRPRQARASPLWQCLQAALPEFLLHYAERHAAHIGPILPERQSALERFLRCGDLSQGFLRVRCEDCDHEYLVPFTCKQRGVCPTCNQRRSVDLAQSIANEICAPVPHRHWVFTIPRLLRPVFRREPRRLGLLARLTADCLTEYLRERSNLPEGRPGIVLAFHTFGDYLAFHPHIHVLATAGAFDAEGHFHLVSPGGVEELAETFRHRVLQALRAERWISAAQVRKLLAWRHSGFNLDAGATALAGPDPRPRQRLAEYLLRAPFSLQKMSWNGRTRTVLYRSSRSWRTQRNFEVFSADAFIAALCEHIPPKGFQTLRYYGHYSNKARGQRRRRSSSQLPPSNSDAPERVKSAQCPLPTAPSAARKRRSWRQRLLAIWGCDPFRCPCCGGTMRPRGTIESAAKARLILEPLGLWEPVIIDHVTAPRAPPASTRWAVDALDGTVIALEWETHPRSMPDTRLPREITRESQTVAGETIVAFPEPPPKETNTQIIDNQLVLIIEDPDPWAAHAEPVFWMD